MFIQVSLKIIMEEKETEKGSDPFRGWFTKDEVEELLNNDNGILTTTGS